MQFCRNGTNFTIIWFNDGLNPCFLDTVTSSLLCLVSVFCVFIQCCVFGRDSNSDEKKKIKTNCGNALQIILTITLMIEAASHVITQDMARENSQPTGSELLTFICLFCAWCVTLVLLKLKRRHILNSKSSRCHGLILPVLWTLAFIRENLAFISWRSYIWWWSLSR